MKDPKTKESKTFFRGVLRTDQGSVILVAIENMPISPVGASSFATGLDYDNPAEPQKEGAGVGQSIYIGQQYDAATQLDYLNARYYNGTQEQFLSEDPVFLAMGNPYQLQQLGQEDQNILLADPQQLNAYSYGRDNPITKKDPTGRLLPEALVGAGVGALVGLGFQGATDLVTWHYSGWQAYTGAAAGGALYGGIIGATDGASLLIPLVAGGASGAVQSGVTQGLSIATGNQKKFNYGQFWGSVGLSAVAAPLGDAVGGLEIEGVTEGRGSYLSTQNQIYTNLSTQAISPAGIAPSTYAKMTVATAAQQAPVAGLQAILGNLSRILTELSAALAPVKSAH
jgi:RHS repeat-associated protein